MAIGAKVLTRKDMENLAVVLGTQNIIPWTWFDEVDLATSGNPVQLQFFSHTRGANQLYVTNMEASNQFISGKVFVVQEIALDLTQDTLAATTVQDYVKAAQGSAAFDFQINGASYAQDTVQRLLGGGLAGFNGTTAAMFQYACSRAMRPYRLPAPIVIPTQTNFTLTFYYGSAPAPSNPVRLQAKLIGQLARLAAA